MILFVVFGFLAVLICSLLMLRFSDRTTDRRAWSHLVVHNQDKVPRFKPSMVATLPDPARRFFLFSIEEGAVLRTIAEISMRGEIGLGDKQNPRYLPMRARQIIAPPFGLVWELQAGSGLMRISGSDGIVAGRSWVRFWLWNIVPVVRAGGGDDHARSAFGRVVAEAVFFTPAALLPGAGVEWHMINQRRARVTVNYQGMTQTVDVAVDTEGRPLRVTMPRWSNANPDRTYRIQPFGGTLSEFRKFDGFMLPTKIEGGNFFRTPEYFPFYKAQIEKVRFMQATG